MAMKERKSNLKILKFNFGRADLKVVSASLKKSLSCEYDPTFKQLAPDVNTVR